MALYYIPPTYVIPYFTFLILFRHTKSAGILDLFDKVVVAAEVPNGKPAPDVYLKAAELLGVNPAKCRAYEVFVKFLYNIIYIVPLLL